MSEISYRNATAADAALLSRIGAESFTETFGHLYTPENLAAFLVNHSVENWEKELTDPRYTIRLAEQGGWCSGDRSAPFPNSRRCD